MSFHNTNLPRFMEVFAICQPKFSVSVAETINGREIRSIDIEHVKQHYLFQNCHLSKAEFAQFNDFFYSRRGSAYSFRFRDLADYKVNKQIISVGDGIKKSFQLHKIYEDAALPYVRNITKPMNNKIKIFIDEIELLMQPAANSDEQQSTYQIDYEAGIVTLSNPLAIDKKLIAEFEFDVEVRFNRDDFSYSYSIDGSIKLADFNLIEVHK